jgi:two-component system, NtrC family, nitrogen regulation sensor histidine kinase NtrY
VTQRVRFVAYLLAVHLLLAGAGILLFLADLRWLFAAEAMLLLSLITGTTLTRQLFRSVDFARSGVHLIRDHDFTSRLRPIGQPEIDELIAVYNQMVDSLRSERARLQEQHHFLAHILRVSPAGIVILDFDRRIDTLNPAGERFLGTAASRIRGCRLDELSLPFAGMIATLRTNTTAVLSIGAARRVRCHHGTFVDRGFPRSFFLIEELTEELREAQRGAYEKLIRVMAHEVNNSVTASNSLLTSALTYAPELTAASRPDFERALGIVIERTGQLNRFMRSFADVFRLPAPVKTPEPLVELLERNVTLLRAKTDASQLAWHWDVDNRGLVVELDRGQMEQAFLNVLQNAVDATGGRGTIGIRVRSQNGGRPMVTIEDSGPGIAPEAQANLFTPFFSTKPHGQGIGLTLVSEVLAGHGFGYSLERLPDQPTRFTITF